MPRSGARSARRAWRARCARRRREPPTWGSTARWPASRTRTTLHARLIVLWGVNPSTSGIHLIPFIKEARKAGAKLVVVDPRATSLARQADLHIALRPGTDVAVALALHKHLFDSGRADLPFLAEHARGVDELRARAEAWPMARAAEVADIELSDLDAVRRAVRRQQPRRDSLRMGPGAQPQRRQRRCRRARAAGRRRQVRRARRRLLDDQLRRPRDQSRDVDERHTGTLDPHRQHEQAGRCVARLQRSGSGNALRLQLQPAGNDAEPEPGARGSASQRLVHGGVRTGRHRHRAIRGCPPAGDDVRRELRHRQGLRPDQPAGRAPRDRARGRGAAESSCILRSQLTGSGSANPRRRPTRSSESRPGCRQASGASCSSADP